MINKNYIEGLSIPGAGNIAIAPTPAGVPGLQNMLPHTTAPAGGAVLKCADRSR